MHGTNIVYVHPFYLYADILPTCLLAVALCSVSTQQPWSSRYEDGGREEEVGQPNTTQLAHTGSDGRTRTNLS